MTVPDAPEAGRAETLTRPDSPDAPIMAEPDDEMDFERTGEFITSSGHRVRLSSRQLQQVPVARKKRMGVRITIVALMMLIVMVIIGCIIFGMYILFKPESTLTVQEIHRNLYKYDVNKNPFTTSEATFFSIPIPPERERATVLMADSSAAMRDGYLDWAKHNIWAVIPLMQVDEPDHPVQIVFWHDPTPTVYPSKPTRVKDIPRQMLHTKLTEVTQNGGIDAIAAFERVMRGVTPARIFVAAHQLPSDTELQRIIGLMEDGGTDLIFVHLGPYEENVYLKQTAEDLKHISYVPIPDGVLQQWYAKEYLGDRNGPLLEELDPAKRREDRDEGDEAPEGDSE